jgi:hypothetical protein
LELVQKARKAILTNSYQKFSDEFGKNLDKIME